MKCKPFTAVIILCAIVILSVCSLSVIAGSSNSFMAISTPMAFTPATQFPIPITNGSISFSQIGYYENATLVNDTWVFKQLQLDSQQTDLLSSSTNVANLNVTAKDSNITLTSFERLLTPNGSDINNTGSWLTAGWLNYTVTGIGKQVIAIQFNLANWTVPTQDEARRTSDWPINVNVYIDGKADYNVSWTNLGDDNEIIHSGIIPYGTGLIINRATSNVSVQYQWVPVPEPGNQSTGSSLVATKTSFENSSAPYILIIAIASGIIVPSALFSNRHNLKSIITKRTKLKQDSSNKRGSN
jgi:hypothetical protein